jgi:beta-galactosidase
VRFSLAGDGRLIDNLGTVRGSRVLELCNGRAEISVATGQQPSVLCVGSEGVPEAFLKID